MKMAGSLKPVPVARPPKFLADKERRETEVTSLATKIHSWANGEMQCVFHGRNAKKPPPSVDDLKKLCRGQMMEIWDYITTNVKNTDAVKKIRGNLLIKNVDKPPEDSSRVKISEALKLEEIKIQESLSTTNTAISHIGRSLQLFQKKVIDCDEGVRQKKDQLKEMKKKTIILNEMNQLILKKIQAYQENIDNIRLLVGKLEKVKDVENSLKQWQQSKDTKQATKVLDCLNKVNKICSILETTLIKVMRNNQKLETTDASTYLGNDEKQELWKMAWELSCSFPMRMILNAILNLSRASIDHLKLDIERINIKKDAESLQFSYDGHPGQIVDLSKPPELPQTINEILENSLVDHLTVAMDIERAQNKIIEQQKILNDLLQKLDGLFQDLLVNNKVCIPVAKSLVKENLEVVMANTAFNFMSTKQQELEEEIHKYNWVAKEQEIKLAQIKNFRNVKENKQKLIRMMISQNVGIHEWLMHLKEGIKHYVSNNLCGQYNDTAMMVEPLWNSIPIQLNALKELPMQNLTTLLTRDWSTSPCLSIYSLDFATVATAAETAVAIVPSAEKKQPSLLAQILSELEFPVFKSPEALFQFILTAKCNIACNSILAGQQSDAVEITGKHSNKLYSFRELNELAVRVSSSDRIQNEIVLPKLTTTMEVTQEGLDREDIVHKAIETWWVQPAKQIPTSICVQGHTLQQWLERWGTASAMVLQESMKMQQH